MTSSSKNLALFCVGVLLIIGVVSGILLANPAAISGEIVLAAGVATILFLFVGRPLLDMFSHKLDVRSLRAEKARLGTPGNWNKDI